MWSELGHSAVQRPPSQLPSRSQSAADRFLNQAHPLENTRGRSQHSVQKSVDRFWLLHPVLNMDDDRLGAGQHRGKLPERQSHASATVADASSCDTTQHPLSKLEFSVRLKSVELSFA